MQQKLTTLGDRSFIISREKGNISSQIATDKFNIISIQNTGFDFLILLKKKTENKPKNFIKLVSNDESFTWIEAVKKEYKPGNKSVIYSQNEQLNGVMGLVKCLRREPDGEEFQAFLIADPSAPPFNPNIEFYKEQLSKDLCMNVYKNVSKNFNFKYNRLNKHLDQNKKHMYFSIHNRSGEYIR